MSVEVAAHLVDGVKWVAERPDMVLLTLAVRTEDIGFCTAPLPKDLKLVVPEPIPAPPTNPATFTLDITPDVLDACEPEIRKILLAMGPKKEVH